MTNGIVSITRGGKTIIKVVSGCDGMKADKLAEEIKARGLMTASEIYDAALDVNFGCMGCLVVQAEGETVWRGDDDLGPLYAEKFADPRFNPRWDYGTAEYVRIIELA